MQDYFMALTALTALSPIDGRYADKTAAVSYTHLDVYKRQHRDQRDHRRAP